MFPGSEVCYTDSGQRLITAGSGLVDLDRGLSDVGSKHHRSRRRFICLLLQNRPPARTI